MPDWEAIIREHGPAVWQTAYRLVNDRADADDCMQETFVAAVGLAPPRQGSMLASHAQAAGNCTQHRLSTPPFVQAHAEPVRTGAISRPQQRPAAGIGCAESRIGRDATRGADQTPPAAGRGRLPAIPWRNGIQRDIQGAWAKCQTCRSDPFPGSGQVARVVNRERGQS